MASLLTLRDVTHTTTVYIFAGVFQFVLFALNIFRCPLCGLLSVNHGHCDASNVLQNSFAKSSLSVPAIYKGLSLKDLFRTCPNLENWSNWWKSRADKQNQEQ